MRCEPGVTIGLCVKNVEQTVKEATQSVLIQDFPHELMELIVVDGCSADKTLSIIREVLSNSDIRTRIFWENEGLGVARQIVVDNADGDYIVWVDGDVVLAKDYVRKQVMFMEANPRISVACGRFMALPSKSFLATLENIEWVVTDYIYGQNRPLRPLIHRSCGSTYRVKAVKQAGGFDCQIKGALEDLDMEYKIEKTGWLSYFNTTAHFSHRQKETWREIWHENFWYGCGGHYFSHKHRKRVSASKLLEGLRRASVAYRLTHRKMVFLSLPVYFLKKIAWYFGFIKAHMEGYGHNFAKVQ